MYRLFLVSRRSYFPACSLYSTMTYHDEIQFELNKLHDKYVRLGHEAKAKYGKVPERLEQDMRRY
jgi:hypothetical protein